jgi:hypothetical protein
MLSVICYRNLDWFNFSNSHSIPFKKSGELRFAPPFPNTRTRVRMFGNEFLSSKFMTAVRKHLYAGDRNRKKVGESERANWMFGMECSLMHLT